MAEFFPLAAGPPGGGIGHPGPHILAHTGNQPHEGSQNAGTGNGTAVRQQISQPWHNPVAGGFNRFIGRVFHDHQHFGKTKRTDQHRQQAKTTGQIDTAIAETLIGMDTFLAHHGDQQTQKTGYPAFQGIIQRG